MNLFDVARQITAGQVAQREGIELKRHGTRLWACCPLHSGGTERTASLCFFQDGGWKCFGCGAGGSDGASFFAALHGLSQYEAAKQLAGSNRIEHREQPKRGRQLRRLLKKFRNRKQVALCDTMHRAQAVLNAIQGSASTWDACWNNTLFIAALEAYSAADIEYEQLNLALPKDLLEMVATYENDVRSA